VAAEFWEIPVADKFGAIPERDGAASVSPLYSSFLQSLACMLPLSKFNMAAR
jgi:hypothetical protein